MAQQAESGLHCLLRHDVEILVTHRRDFNQPMRKELRAALRKRRQPTAALPAAFVTTGPRRVSTGSAQAAGMMI